MLSVRGVDHNEKEKFIAWIERLLYHLQLESVFSLVAPLEGQLQIKRTQEPADISQRIKMDSFLRALRGNGLCKYNQSVTEFYTGNINAITINEINPGKCPENIFLVNANELNQFNPDSRHFNPEEQIPSSEQRERLLAARDRREAVPSASVQGLAEINKIIQGVGLEGRFKAVVDAGQLIIKPLSRVVPGTASRNKLLALAEILIIGNFVDFGVDREGVKAMLSRPEVSLPVVRIRSRLVAESRGSGGLDACISNTISPGVTPMAEYLNNNPGSGVQLVAAAVSPARDNGGQMHGGRNRMFLPPARPEQVLAGAILQALAQGHQRRNPVAARGAAEARPTKPDGFSTGQWEAVPPIIRKYWGELSDGMREHVKGCLEANIEAAIEKLDQECGVTSAVLNDANRDAIMGTTPRFPALYPEDEVKHDLVNILEAYDKRRPGTDFRNPYHKRHVPSGGGPPTDVVKLNELMPDPDAVQAIKANIAEVRQNHGSAPSA